MGRPRILEEGNLFEHLQPYNRSHGKLKARDKNSQFILDTQTHSLGDSLVLGKHIGSIFNIKNNSTSPFIPDIVEIDRIEHSYHLVVNENPKSVERINDPVYDVSGKLLDIVGSNVISTLVKEGVGGNVWGTDMD